MNELVYCCDQEATFIAAGDNNPGGRGYYVAESLESPDGSLAPGQWARTYRLDAAQGPAINSFGQCSMAIDFYQNEIYILTGPNAQAGIPLVHVYRFGDWQPIGQAYAGSLEVIWDMKFIGDTLWVAGQGPGGVLSAYFDQGSWIDVVTPDIDTAKTNIAYSISPLRGGYLGGTFVRPTGLTPATVGALKDFGRRILIFLIHNSQNIVFSFIHWLILGGSWSEWDMAP